MGERDQDRLSHEGPRLTVVGCGTAAPQPGRTCSGYWVEAAGLRILFDCGAGVVLSMTDLGVPWQTMTHLVLTHFHTDHIGGISMLFFASRWGIQPARSEPLTVIGPVGTRSLFERLGAAYGEHFTDPWFPVDIQEIEPGGAIDLGEGYTLAAVKAQHTPEAVSYRLDHGDPVLGYTGDTGDDEAVADFMAGVRVFVCECSVPDEEEMHLHLTPRSVAKFAKRAQPDLLIATHVYPQLDRDGIPEQLRERGWEGETAVAYEGFTTEL